MAADEDAGTFGGVLGIHVHIDGRAYGPADGELPVAVARRITNPDVWAEEPRGDAVAPRDTARDVDPLESVRAELERLRAAEADRQRAEVRDSGAGVATGEGTGTPTPVVVPPERLDVPPPMAGAGSGTPEWLAYAGRVGVEVPEADRGSRARIIELIDAAGKPTGKPAE